MFVTTCIMMVCAGRDHQDPLRHVTLKHLGIYPVIDGWAHVDVDQVAGMGEDFDSALYIRAGDAQRITPHT